MKDFIEKVIDKSIFDKQIKIMVPMLSKCKTCNATGFVTIPNGPMIICPTCQGRLNLDVGEKKEVVGEVQYVPIAFEKNKSRIIQISITYYEEDRPINISVSEEDILGFVEDDKLQDDEAKKEE